MMRSKFVAIILAAQLLVIASACKDTSKPAAKVAATQGVKQTADDEPAAAFTPLTPPPNPSAEQLLIIAAYNGDLPVIQKTLAGGADINARFEISSRNIDDDLLHAQPAALSASTVWRRRPELFNHIGNSALDEALLRGRLDVAAYLLDHGADINARSPYGPAAIEVAFTPKSLDFVIARGADVNAKNNNGESPLFLAAVFFDAAIVDKLLKAGADVNATNHRGETPLHVVGDARMAELLVRAGARLDLKDEIGSMPLMKVEWSVERIELSRAALMRPRRNGPGGSRGGQPRRGSDQEELERSGVRGELLSHRLNDLRSTETKAIAGVLKKAGAK